MTLPNEVCHLAMAPWLVEDGLPNWFEQYNTDSENAAAAMSPSSDMN
jgi:hypothetical protein